MSSLTLLVRLEMLLVPCAWIGACIAVLAICGVGIACALGALTASGVFGAVWLFGILIAMTSIYVGAWAPLAFAGIGAGVVVITGGVRALWMHLSTQSAIRHGGAPG